MLFRWLKHGVNKVFCCSLWFSDSHSLELPDRYSQQHYQVADCFNIFWPCFFWGPRCSCSAPWGPAFHGSGSLYAVERSKVISAHQISSWKFWKAMIPTIVIPFIVKTRSCIGVVFMSHFQNAWIVQQADGCIIFMPGSHISTHEEGHILGMELRVQLLVLVPPCMCMRILACGQ